MASKKILCPYCFNEFDNTQVLYQCESEERDNEGEYRCRRVTSEQYDRYWHGEDLLIRNVWEQKGGLKARLFGPKFDAQKCPECGYKSRRFVCPHCMNWLPTEMIENGSEIISVIGSPSSGKTNYIIALIHQLRKYGYKMDLQVIPTQIYRDGHKEEATHNLFKKMDEQLFTQKTVLQKTSDKKTDIPWIFHLYQPSTGKSIYLVFYDTAGEKFQIDIKNTVKYLKESSGVILILDTLSIDFVQDILKKKGLAGLGGTSASYEEIQTALNNFKTES
ncbi:MAG: transposase, partial [Muribaculaceae bacterium]|nr:transposase [Muribaculaceae bacterium]